MRVFSFVLLLAGAQADEIASLHKWEQEYRSTVVLANLDASAANRAITGSHEPDATTLQPLWRWYRTVDAAHQAKAKEVMQGAGRTATAEDLNVAAVVDFSTKYNAAVKVGADADKKATIMYEVLGAHEPATATTLKAWNLYQAMDASTRAAVRTAIIEKPFLEGFHAAWKLAMAPNANKYHETLTLVGNTMRGTPPIVADALAAVKDGQNTFPLYAAIRKASPDSDDALLKHMRAVMMGTLDDIVS